MRHIHLMSVAALGLSLIPAARAAVFDLQSQWSDAANPNGAWSYREGGNVLPHVASWQSSVGGGWNTAQPGWAKSENGSDRLPFFFKSNGSETFAHDYLQGDIIVHSTDPTNGVGSGPAAYVWTSPASGVVSIAGGVWMGRDIGRSNHWSLTKNGTTLTGGDIASGDVYSRSSPFTFATGTGGASAVTGIPIIDGDQIALVFTQTSGSGDFVGTHLTLTTIVPEPTTAAVSLPAVLLSLRRARR